MARAPEPTTITEISHADARDKVDLLRKERDGILAAQDEARRLHDEHVCAAVLSGEEIDASFRQRIDQLEARRSALDGIVKALEARLQTLHQQEIDRARAERRTAAEAELSQLRQTYAEAAKKMVNAVLEAQSAFGHMVSLVGPINRILSGEFSDLNRTPPRLVPGLISLGHPTLMNDWEETVCQLGYGDLIPDTSVGKRRFVARTEKNRPEE